MFQQQLAPVGSLAISALIALIPLITLFFLLGVLRLKAHWAGIGALAAALVVAVTAFKMPAHLAVLSGLEGAAFGLFPIIWIVFSALVLYHITVVAGRFNDLRAVFNRVSDDLRIQAIVIAFCFGGLIEALAGFGAPVAITSVMLTALGFPAMRAAIVALLANTAPVAFGAIATPLITAGSLTGIPYTEIGAYVGRQTPLLAAIVPLLLVILVDGKRGLRQTWPAALVVGLAFALTQFVSANFVSVELTDIIASFVALIATALFLRIWQPAGSAEAAARIRSDAQLPHARSAGVGGTGAGTTALATRAGEGDTGEPADGTTGTVSGARMFMAFLPYLLVIVVFSVANLNPDVKRALGSVTEKIPWPGLDGHVLNADGKPLSSTIFTFNWLATPGTLLMVCAILTALLYRVPLSQCMKQIGATAFQLRHAVLTVAAVLALAYVMNQSGQTITIGAWIAATGGMFAFLSPILGWIGTAVTGSDTSANALFATLQQAAGVKAGIDPTLLVAANTSGGVVGKMISPQNLTIAAISVGIAGKEGDLFRKLILWSLGLLAVLCVLVYLQSTPVLS
jgi:lactate permease